MTAEHPPAHGETWGIVRFVSGEDGVTEVDVVNVDPSEGSIEHVTLTESNKVDGQEDVAGSVVDVGIVYPEALVDTSHAPVSALYLCPETGEWYTVEVGEVDVGRLL